MTNALSELAEALHELHRDAGKPGARRISLAVRDRSDLRDTVSHETVSAMLRGTALARWGKVECVVRQLAAWSVTGRDADAEVRRFHRLWLAASDGRTEPEAPVEKSPVISNSPPRAAHFTGRRHLLAAIRGALDKQGAVVALTGLGGVGKTRVAREYAHRWAGDYDLVWWIPAEQPTSTVTALAALGDRLGLRTAADMRQTVRAVLTALEESSLRWLLVYDNADRPHELQPLMPMAGGHTLVTSRNAAWSGLATAVRVDVFERAESIEFLREWGVAASTADAQALAERLGDLPLALYQVCAMQTATGMPIAEYLRLFAEHVEELLSAGRPDGAPATVTTLVSVAAGKLRGESAAAAHLLELLAFMAPDPVPLSLLHRGRDARVSAPLGRALHRAGELRRLATLLGRYGLARLDPAGEEVQVHRLVQLVVRDALSEADAAGRLLDVHRLLGAASPGSPDHSSTWTQHGEITAHLLASDAVHAAEASTLEAVLHQIRYLERIGDYEASVNLARKAVDAWREAPDLGPEHRYTIRATRQLANALRALGAYAESQEMIMDALNRLRAAADYGDDHPDTLSIAAVAAFHLRLDGRYGEALALDTARVDGLTRRYGAADPRVRHAVANLTVNLRLTGEPGRALALDDQLAERLDRKDPLFLVAARNRAWDLLDLGQPGEAVDLQERWMPPRSRHDDWVMSARTRAIGLRRLGRADAARTVATETYRVSQDRFGPDHHLTLAAVMTYANTLRALGDPVGARPLITEALDRYRRLFGERNPLTLAAAANLAVLLRALGRKREAYGTSETTRDELVRALGPDHPHALVTAIGLATDLALDRLVADAVALGRATLDGLRRSRGDDHPETLICAVNLATDTGTGRREAIERLAARLGSAHPDVRAAATGARLECDIEPPPA